jgi:hypothetical protein
MQEEKMIIETWHADSSAGPMSELKKAIEAKHTDVTVSLTLRTLQRQILTRLETR